MLRSAPLDSFRVTSTYSSSKINLPLPHTTVNHLHCSLNSRIWHNNVGSTFFFFYSNSLLNCRSPVHFNCLHCSARHTQTLNKTRDFARPKSTSALLPHFIPPAYKGRPMSSVDLPSIQTSFAPFSISSSSLTTATSLGFLSPAMTLQSRSYSTSSSLPSTYCMSDRSLSVSPGPATPCDVASRSPSFSHDSIYNKPLPNNRPHFPSYPSHPSSPQSSPQRYTSTSRHHPYFSLQQHHHHHQSKPYYQERSHYSQHPPSTYSSFKPLPSPLSPREMFSVHSPRNQDNCHAPFHHKQEEDSYHHQERHLHSSNSDMDQPHHRNLQMDYFQSRSSSSFSSGYSCSSDYPLMTPKEEERDSPILLRPLSLPTAVSRSEHHDNKRRVMSPPVEDDHYASSMSPSPSLSHAGSFSRESSPGMDSEYLGSMSEASASMSSLASLSSSSSMTPIPTTTQLLLCPVCNRAFKPSKNQNCNLRRHLKNVHNMSPTIHPRKCKWDSLPDGRVKDDKDRKERTRKSKRLWARKFRLRRKVEEAAVVLSMLSQAV